MSRILSHRRMVVLGGAASYSLYLLRFCAMGDLGHWLTDGRRTGPRALVFVL
jgi:peptidoglycan/LPS O-acetylase OafA/YrhL